MELNPNAPKILNDIVKALSKANLTAVTEDDEGRVNSKKDEANVVNWLKKHPKFKNHIASEGLRKFGDIIVTDEKGVNHQVNIKTSIGSPDNAFSKLGFLWAFTDLPIEEMPKKITNKKWFELITKHKKETTRDYWFLSLDKNDMNKVMVRGVKQIQNWVHNPSNNLQISWRKEHATTFKQITFEEAWQTIIIDGVLYCWEKNCEGMQAGIKYRQSLLKK